MNILELSEQEIIRRNSLNELRAMGIDPYPAAEYVTNAFSTDIKAEFKDEDEPRQVSVAGRIMSRRVMGKASFIELQDSKGRIQVYITRDDICPGEDKELYNSVFKRLLDLGDFIGIEGFVFRTQMGEISIHAKKLTVLAKSIKPLPIVKYKDGVAYDSFEDPELRYRQRYVDLVVNDGIKETFLKRATVVKTLRNVLDEAGYTEVETPILQSIAGGASARPFITHHNSLDIDLYLRIATELYLKRLIVGGFEGVYEIGKNFRNEGMDKTHNPEFTCMELYVQYKDYNWMMNFTEKLLERICIAVNGCTESVVDGKTISFKAPYRRLPILDAIKEKTGYDVLGKDTLSFIVSILPRIGQLIMSSISSLAVNLFVMIFVLYFMLIGGKKMEAYINDILPFNETNTREVIHEINMIVRSNAIGIPLLAIIQGGIAMIGYLIFGAPNVLLLGFLTCFATIIPMVGTALVWFPVASYLAISGDWFHAIGLFAYGAIVVSQSDNLIRFILQKKMADTHPLITIFGVVIGLPLFGFMGIIFGPLLLSLFFLFVNMFKKEYLDS